jgi:hypothetical protein
VGKKDDGYTWIISYRPYDVATVQRVPKESVRDAPTYMKFKTKEVAYKALLEDLRQHVESQAEHVENARHTFDARRQRLSKLRLRRAVLETQLELGTLPPGEDEV